MKFGKSIHVVTKMFPIWSKGVLSWSISDENSCKPMWNFSLVVAFFPSQWQIVEFWWIFSQVAFPAHIFSSAENYHWSQKDQVFEMIHFVTLAKGDFQVMNAEMIWSYFYTLFALCYLIELWPNGSRNTNQSRGHNQSLIKNSKQILDDLLMLLCVQ